MNERDKEDIVLRFQSQQKWSNVDDIDQRLISCSSSSPYKPMVIIDKRRMINKRMREKKSQVMNFQLPFPVLFSSFTAIGRSIRKTLMRIN